jgi:signal transduction histidine kinase
VAAWLGAGIAMSVVMLAWFGFRASREWQRSSVLLVERYADEAASLLVTALVRDMRAAHTSILASPLWEAFTFESPYAVTTLVASAFARYPYPEAFFAWEGGTPPGKLSFFTRSDRPPAWADPAHEPGRYPVRMAVNHQLATIILRQVEAAAAQTRELSVADLEIDSIPHQVVILIRYRDRVRQQVAGVSGFTVNLAWARAHYFPDLTKQVSRIGGPDRGLAFGILDDRDEAIVTTRPFQEAGPVSRRAFPLHFFDSAAVAINPPESLPGRQWSVRVSGAADPALTAAIRGSNRTVMLATFAAAVLIAGLVLATRAIRANAGVAAMRTDFVASITHELKTPIATIQAAGATLAAGRLRSADAQREYAQLVVHEAKRLSRLVDNLLAHARVTDVADVYTFEAVEVEPLVRGALAAFSRQLQQARFSLCVNLPTPLPAIRADRSSMQLVLDNLIDNAIKYSGPTKEIRVTAAVRGGRVAIEIADRGIGVDGDDLERVTQRFVRGRNATAPGSGLGLSIVRRVIQNHGGRFTIRSAPNQGTAVTVEIPAMASDVRERSQRYRARIVS